MKKSSRSPEKEVVVELATKLYTVISPLGPSYRLKLTPPMVVVAMAEPVEEMGPAPPSAASQTMISYSSEPEAVDDRNMS